MLPYSLSVWCLEEPPVVHTRTWHSVQITFGSSINWAWLASWHPRVHLGQMGVCSPRLDQVPRSVGTEQCYGMEHRLHSDYLAECFWVLFRPA